MVALHGKWLLALLVVGTFCKSAILGIHQLCQSRPVVHCSGDAIMHKLPPQAACTLQACVVLLVHDVTEVVGSCIVRYIDSNHVVKQPCAHAMQVYADSSSFANNSAGRGGGMVAWGAAQVTLNNSTFRANIAPTGAALSFQENSTATCTSLSVLDNRAVATEAGSYSGGGAFEVVDAAQVCAAGWAGHTRGLNLGCPHM